MFLGGGARGGGHLADIKKNQYGRRGSKCGEEPSVATREILPGRVDAWTPPCACVYVCVCLRCRGANNGEAEAGQRARTVPSLSNHTAVKLGREIFPECSRVFELIPGY